MTILIFCIFQVVGRVQRQGRTSQLKLYRIWIPDLFFSYDFVNNDSSQLYKSTVDFMKFHKWNPINEPRIPFYYREKKYLCIKEVANSSRTKLITRFFLKIRDSNGELYEYDKTKENQLDSQVNFEIEVVTGTIKK